MTYFSGFLSVIVGLIIPSARLKYAAALLSGLSGAHTGIPGQGVAVGFRHGAEADASDGGLAETGVGSVGDEGVVHAPLLGLFPDPHERIERIYLHGELDLVFRHVALHQRRIVRHCLNQAAGDGVPELDLPLATGHLRQVGAEDDNDA